MVKKHAKVAEEAVSGWEKAGSEVFILKQQLEAVTQNKSVLEDRVCHIDGALKECLRQLRQVREEQEQKIQEAVSNKNIEWESTKTMLENQLVELQVQLHVAKTKYAASYDLDLNAKLEESERENCALKTKILSLEEEINIRTIESDLSTQAAETASKQYLDSMKKVARLEAECRRLNTLARKISPANEHKSFTDSSFYVESYADIQSDYGDRLPAVETDVWKVSGLELTEAEELHSGSGPSAWIKKNCQDYKALERKPTVPLAEIGLMDDFLEMERLAALQDTRGCVEAGSLENQPSGKILLNADLEAMMNRAVELEEKVGNLERNKVELEMALTEREERLVASQIQLKEADVMLAELQTELTLKNESNKAAEEEMKFIITKREMAESQLKDVEAEMKFLHSKVFSLEEMIEKERALAAESSARCRKLEDELSKVKHVELYRRAILHDKLKMKQEEELAVAASKFAVCQKTIASLGQQLKSLATFEDFMIDSGTLQVSF